MLSRDWDDDYLDMKALVWDLVRYTEQRDGCISAAIRSPCPPYDPANLRECLELLFPDGFPGDGKDRDPWHDHYAFCPRCYYTLRDADPPAPKEKGYCPCCGKGYCRGCGEGEFTEHGLMCVLDGLV